MVQNNTNTNGKRAARKEHAITVLDVLPKRYFRSGELHQPPNTQGTYNAEIKPRNSIRIFGKMTNRVSGALDFDKTFKVGDRAEYDSYNLTYVGDITTIGEKIIGIRDGDRLARLSIYGFIDRNYNFDEAKINAENAVESQCI